MTRSYKSLINTSKMPKTTVDKLVKHHPSHPHSNPCSILRETLLSPFLILAFIISIIIFCQTDVCHISTIPAPDKLAFAMGDEESGCDIFVGSWVRDYNRPLYEEWECPYIEPQLTCLEHGRPEKEYRYWRWQPDGCFMPRFNASFLLESLRGKTMMFVGDSLNRGQFTSMICLVNGLIPENAKSFEHLDSRTVFTAKEYDARIVFYWAPFLMESNADDPNKHRVDDRAIRNGSIDKHGENWKQADILVFNTYIWWIRGFRIVEGSIDNDASSITIPMEDGYRIAMKSLVEWINKNMDPRRQRAFFTSMSPTHQWSYKWGEYGNGSCYNETTILEDLSFFGAETILMRVASEEVMRSEFPITFLNITQLSSARKDAHTSIYKQQWSPLTEEQLANPVRIADCIHWCLPGLQDIWNEMLFYKLFYR